MSKITKRLLSLLVVIAMVVAMVPATGIPAVEAQAEQVATGVIPEAAQAEIARAASLGNKTAEELQAIVEGTTCPMCGAKDISWTKLGTGNNDAIVDGASYHWYATGAFATTNKHRWISTNDINSGKSASNVTVCVVLKDDAQVTSVKAPFRMSGDNNTLNVMGNGSVTTDNSDIYQARGVFAMEGVGTNINLYGGTYVFDSTAGVGVVESKGTGGGSVNIYNNTVIGKAEKSDAVSQNLVVGNYTLNMYGGTIRNGRASNNDHGGNVTVNGGAFNMYGGTLTGGTAGAYGGNLYVRDGAAKIYGGTMSNGTVAAAFGEGGNLTLLGSSAVVEIYGGNFVNGVAPKGGNVSAPKYHYNGGAACDGDLAIYGGNFSGGNANGVNGETGAATGRGGNLYAMSDGLVIENATFENGIANDRGGNIYVENDVAVSMENTTVTGGSGTNLGSNIYVNAPMTITGGKIIGNYAAAATSIYANKAVTFNNVIAGAELGHNIQGTSLTFNGGYYYGTQEPRADRPGAVVGDHDSNIKCESGTLVMNGGTYTGAITTNKSNVTLAGTVIVKNNITVPGDDVAKKSVAGLDLQSLTTPMNIDGLNADSSIYFMGAANQLLATSENAVNVANCFGEQWNGGCAGVFGNELRTMIGGSGTNLNCGDCGKLMFFKYMGTTNEFLADYDHVTITANTALDTALFAGIEGAQTLHLQGKTLTLNAGINIGTGKVITDDWGTGKVVGTAAVDQGTLTLCGNASFADLRLGADGKLVLKNWTGSATLDITNAEIGENNVLVDVTVEGKPGGELVTSNGEAITYVDGQFVADLPAPDVEADCPFCKAPVTWTAFDGKSAVAVAGEHKHFYLAKDVNFDGGDKNVAMFDLQDNGNVCLNLNGKTLTVKNGYFNIGKDSANLKVVANGGQIQFNTKSLWGGFFKVGYGSLMIDGGTYTALEGNGAKAIWTTRNVILKDVVVNGTLDGIGGDFELQGATYVNDVIFESANSAVKLNSNWTGSLTLTPMEGDWVDNKLSASRVFYEGDKPSGEAFLNDGTKLMCKNGALELYVPHVDELIVDENGYGVCPACGNVQWTVFDGKTMYNGITEHMHFYLTDDTTYEWDGSAATRNMMAMAAGGKVCFHLNGYTLTTNEGAFTLNSADNALNLFAKNGAINYKYTGGYGFSVIKVAAGSWNVPPVYVEGGTFTPMDGNIKPFLWTTRPVVLKDATVNGFVEFVGGNVELQGATTIAQTAFYADYNQSGIKLNSNWTGTLPLTLLEGDMVDGQINTARISYTGAAPTGVVTVGGETMVYQNGKVMQDGSQDPLTVDHNNQGICPICEATVTWTKLTTDMDFKSEEKTHSHIYLANDLDYKASWALLEIANENAVCLHTNGYDLTTGSFIILTETATLNIYGYGSTYTWTAENINSNCGIAVANGTTLNIKGGTYSYNHIKHPDRAEDASLVPFSFNGMVDLTDATFTYDIEAGNGHEITLWGATNIPNIDFRWSMGTMRGQSSWSGTVNLLNLHPTTFVYGEATTSDADRYHLIQSRTSFNTNGGRFTTDGHTLMKTSLDEDGPLTMPVYIVTAEGQTAYYNMNKAVAAYTADDFNAGNYIITYAGSKVELAGDNYYIDARANDMMVTGTGNLYAMNSANDDFKGHGSWSVAEGVEIVRDFVAPDNMRYLVITTAEGVTSSHRLVLELAGVSINTEDDGLYYNAQYMCSDTVTDLIQTYGVIASLKDMPGAKMTNGDERTELHTFVTDENHAVLSDSSTVYGIFKDSRTAAKNAQYGQMKIYANPYIELDVDGDGDVEVIVGDTENVGKKAGNAWSLYDVLKNIDDNWEANADQQEAVNAFYAKWADKGMSEYGFANIA